MSAALDLFYVTTFARFLAGRRHPLIGTNAPGPACAALLARELAGGDMRVTILGSPKHSYLSDDLSELFDSAARGVFDAFFIGGGQIDGQGNVNLVGVGAYPKLARRWPGSHGTPLLYMMIPNAILYVSSEHTPKTLVNRVDFISAPGTSDAAVHRPGGPIALVTPRCVFRFDRDRGRFTLVSLNAGHTIDEIKAQTGFAFDVPAQVGVTEGATPRMLTLLRDKVAPQIERLYPRYTEALVADVELELAGAVASGD